MADFIQQPAPLAASGGAGAGRLEILDGLRALSILLVLACHLLPLGPNRFRLNEAAGAMGMSLFFALSGFLIATQLLADMPIGNFLARRLARILPLAYLYSFVIFTVFVFSPDCMFWTDIFAVNYKQDCLVVGLSNHYWSLCVEVQFYLAIAATTALAGRRGVLLVWPACIAVSAFAFSRSEYSSIETHFRVAEILSGACLACVLARLPPIASVGGSRLAMISASLLWAVASHPFSGAVQVIRPYVTAALVYGGIQYGRALPQTALRSWPLAYIAKISYALYIIHPLAAHGWMNEGGPLTKYVFKRPITFLLTFGLAHLSTFHFEGPLQEFVKTRLRRRPLPASDGGISAETSLPPPLPPGVSR